MNSPRHKIINGNCIDVLRKVPNHSIDLVLTDPPYLVGYRDRSGRSILNDRSDDWIVPAFEQVQRVLKPNSCCVSFYGWNHAEKFLSAWKAVGLRPVGHLVWAKSYASHSGLLRSVHECAYLLTNGRPQEPQELINDVLPWSYSGNKLHPTQKPVSALEPVIAAFSKTGDVVLDPFCGSGSTGIAARQLGREFLGIELDPKYFEVACQRLAA